MSMKQTFSLDDVQRAVRKNGVLRLLLWFLLIFAPISLALQLGIGLFPWVPIAARAVVALGSFSAGGCLFIWKFIRMSQEDAP